MADEPKPDLLTYWIDLAKWLIVSVGLVIMTTIIDRGFKDRAAGIVEMNAHDKYVTDLIVLNKEVGPRRLLAQYFANVTASDKLRRGWEKYYALLDSEYRAIANRDTVIADQQRALLIKPVLTRSDSFNLERIDLERRDIKRALDTPLKPLEPIVVRPTDAASANVWEEKGFKDLAQRDAKGAIEAFEMAEHSYNGYHNAYDLARYLKQNEALQNTNDTALWNAALQHIVTNYSWGMPQGTKKMILRRSQP